MCLHAAVPAAELTLWMDRHWRLQQLVPVVPLLLFGGVGFELWAFAYEVLYREPGIGYLGISDIKLDNKDGRPKGIPLGVLDHLFIKTGSPIVIPSPFRQVGP